MVTFTEVEKYAFHINTINRCSYTAMLNLNSYRIYNKYITHLNTTNK